MTARAGRSRTIRVAVLLAALATCVARVAAPPHRAPPPPAPLPEDDGVYAVDRRTHPATPPSDGPGPDEVRAVGELARALGYVWVDCPTGDLWIDYPEYHELFAGGAFAASVGDGVTTLRRAETERHATRFGEVERVVRWTTDAGGATTCREEPPVRGEATVRVVGEDGAPREALLAIEPSDPGLVSYAASTWTFDVYNGGPVWVAVRDPEWTGPRVAVRDGDDVEIVVTPAETEFGARYRREVLADTLARWSAAEALLRDPGTDPALVPALIRITGDLHQLADYRSRWFDANGDPVEGNPSWP